MIKSFFLNMICFVIFFTIINNSFYTIIIKILIVRKLRNKRIIIQPSKNKMIDK